MRVVLRDGDLCPTRFQAAFVENECVGSKHPPDGNRHLLFCLPVMRFRQPESRYPSLRRNSLTRIPSARSVVK